MVNSFKAHIQWPTKNLSFPPAQSFFFDSKSDLMIGADYESKILLLPWFKSTCWEIFSFEPSNSFELLPQNDMQEVASEH
jgi:hypothetical protein